MGDTFVRFLKGLAISILCMVIFALGIKFMINRFRESGDERDKLREQRAKIVEQSKSQSPEGKVVITDELLKVDYEIYYSEKKDMRDLFSFFMFGATGVIALFSAISLGVSIFKKKVSVPRIIACVLPVVLTVGMMIFFNSRNIAKIPPKPEKTSRYAESVKITKKNTKTTTDRDENGNATGTTTTHYIYFFNRQNEAKSYVVGQSVYDKVKEGDSCYMAYAEAKGKEIYYQYYDPAVYELEKK